MSFPQLGLVVGSQGRGSNMSNIAMRCVDGSLPATVGVVIAPKEDIPSVAAARKIGLNVQIVDPKSPTYANDLVEALKGVQLVCLCGYLRLLPTEVLEAHPNRVINIHPALLPKYGGKGMYGMHVHEAVLAAGERETGCTVHYVTEKYDDGAIIVQKRCRLEQGDVPPTLAARVLALEHQAYIEAIRDVLSL